MSASQTTCTQLITTLQEIVAQHGDLAVYVWDDWLEDRLRHIRVEEPITHEYEGGPYVFPKRVVLHSAASSSRSVE